MSQIKRIKYIFIIISFAFTSNSKGQNHFRVDKNIDYTKIKMIETRVECLNSFKDYEFLEIVKIDSLGRLEYQATENIFWKGGKRSYYYYYEQESILPYKTIYILKQDSTSAIADTTIIRHSYNSKGLLTNDVYTDNTDSLLSIRNYEYNLNKDVVLRSYHTKMEVKSPIDCAPDYTILKDSLVYDYEGNVYVDHLVSSGGIIQSVSAPIKSNNETTIYDEFGNLQENENLKMKYEYDHNGNWILQKKFFKQNGEFELKQIRHRQIKYKN